PWDRPPGCGAEPQRSRRHIVVTEGVRTADTLTALTCADLVRRPARTRSAPSYARARSEPRGTGRTRFDPTCTSRLPLCVGPTAGLGPDAAAGWGTSTVRVVHREQKVLAVRTF